MFGECIDYHLLRPFAVDTQGACLSRPQSRTWYAPQLARFLEHFQGRVSISRRRVLDVGCGDGTLAIEMANAGAAHVLGLDINDRLIDDCKTRLSEESSDVQAKTRFAVQSIHDCKDAGFDLVVSRCAFEHIEAPEQFLRSMISLLAPQGLFAAQWGPAFHSPFGDHQWKHFRFHIPYRCLLFNEKSMLRIRREFYDSTQTAVRWEDLNLNRLRYSEYAAACRRTGLDILLLQPNTSPTRSRLLKYAIWTTNRLVGASRLADYVAHAPVSLLRKAK